MSTELPRLTQQFFEFRIDFDRAVQRSLKFSPLCRRKLKVDAVSKSLICRHDPRIEKKLTDVFVCRTRGFLEQLLHGRSGANVNAFGFWLQYGGHGISPVVEADIVYRPDIVPTT